MAYYSRPRTSYRSYRNAGFRGGYFGYARSRATSYYGRARSYAYNKKKVWAGKLASYRKGRWSGIMWGFIFCLILIPCLIFAYKKRDVILAKFKGGN